MGFSLKQFGRWIDPTSSTSGVRNGLRNMDPTTATGRKNLLYGGVYGAAFGPAGDVDKELAAGRPPDTSAWDAKTAEYEASLRSGGHDDAVEKNYYDQADTGITAAQNQAGEASAESYARRGLGSSGLASGAASDVTLQAGAARATARQRALDAATAAKRGQTLDAWGVAAKAKQMDLDYQKWLEEKRAREQAAEDKALGDLVGLGAKLYTGGAFG
jgi:hypothetical protein